MPVISRFDKPYGGRRESDVAVWLYDHGGKASYKVSKQALEDMGICEQGVQNGLELACSDYESVDGLRVQLKGFFDGYVLTDVKIIRRVE